MDEEGYKKVYKLSVGILFVISIFQIIPATNLVVNVADADSQWTEDNESDFSQGMFERSALYGIGSSSEIGLGLNLSGNWQKMSPSIEPPARRGHVISSIYDTDLVLLFGGFDGSYLDDTWIYDLSDDEWIDMMPLGGKPTARHSYGMTFVYGTDKMLLFGGASQSILDNETWLYDLILNTWTKLNPQISPSAREYHELEPVYNDDRVILYGGFDGTSDLDDTWVYDISDNEWVQMSPFEKPSPRKGHEMATIYGTDEIVYFGGNESGLNLMDDTWVYKHSTNEWTNITPTVGNPSPRRGQGMGCFYGTDQVLLFGPDDETWIYDLSDNIWTLKTTPINPSPRDITHGITPVFNDDKVILFGGGFDDNGSIINLNDTWVYDLVSYEEEGTFISSPLNVGMNTLLKSLNWIEDAPNGTNVKFQLRSASSEAGLLSENFVGSDGTSGNYYTNSQGEIIWSGHQGDPWVQYKIYLSGNSESTPLIKEVNIIYNHLPDQPQIIRPENDVWITQNTPEFTWAFSDSDSLQGGFQVLIDDDENYQSIDYDSSEQSSNLEKWQFPQGTSYSQISDGLWFWKVKTQDSDGDWGPYSSSFLLKIDSSEPISSISTPINIGFYKSVSSISGSASDNGGSGIESIEITLKNVNDGLYWNGVGWDISESWLLTTGTLDWSYDFASVNWENGKNYEVSVHATDLASNIGTGYQKNIFTIDSFAPTTTINPLLNIVYLSHLDTITGSAQDPNGAGVDYVEVNLIRSSDNKKWDGSIWNEGDNWHPALGINSWSFDSRDVDWSQDTYYTVRAYATDKAGNIGSYNEVSFMIDSTSPSDLSITINNGDSFTKISDVTLYLHAQDLGSGLDKMGFSSDGTHWSIWEDYKVTKPYSLTSGDGQKTIYFRVKDKAGNQANGIFTQITVDTSEPVSDLDEDGIQDNLDAFPEDAAASIDTDSDGFPDSWNPGKSQGHSSTGLTLDEFPSDPSLHATEITQPEEQNYDTYWFLIIPFIAIILLVVFVLLMWRNKKKISKIVLFYRRYF